jgi:Zn finger protein HypA/HybF involved in hydrogenase expression
MNMDEIIRKHADVERRLIFALSTMEKKTTINEIHRELLELQNKCPHFDLDYNWPVVEGKCPYCGRNLEGVL